MEKLNLSRKLMQAEALSKEKSNTLQLQNEELKMKNELLEKEAKMLKESSKKIEGEFYEAIAHRNQVQSNFNTKDSIISKLELELVQIKKQHQSDLQNAQKQNESEITKLQNQLSEVSNQNKSLQQDKVINKKDQVTKIHGLVTELTQIQKQKNSLQTQVDALESKNDELSEANHELKISKQKLERQLDGAKDDFKLSELKLKKVEIEKKEIEDAYESNLKKRNLILKNRMKNKSKIDQLEIDEEQDFGIENPEKELLDTKLRVISSGNYAQENERLRLENKKLVRLNKVLNKKLVDIVAKRVIDRANKQGTKLSAGPISGQNYGLTHTGTFTHNQTVHTAHSGPNGQTNLQESARFGTKSAQNFNPASNYEVRTKVIHDASGPIRTSAERITFAQAHSPTKVIYSKENERSPSPFTASRERLTPKRIDNIEHKTKVVSVRRAKLEDLVVPQKTAEYSVHTNRDPQSSFYTQVTPLSMNTTSNESFYHPSEVPSIPNNQVVHAQTHYEGFRPQDYTNKTITEEYYSNQPLQNIHFSRTDGFDAKKECQRLLELNQTSIMNSGEFQRSGQYTEIGVPGVGLYDDLDKVSEEQLQSRIQQIISMNNI